MENPYSSENAIRRSLRDFSLPKQLKLRLGKLILPFVPQKAREVEAAPYGADSYLHRLVRNGLYAQALENKDFGSLRSYLSKYWYRPKSGGLTDNPSSFE